MSITYRLAQPGGEYNRLYALMKKERGEKEPLGWPTVVAEEDGKVIGFLSTYPSDEFVFAEPLVIEGGHRPWVFIRLVEAYDTVMRMAGMKFYGFRVEKSNPKQIERVEKVGFKRVSETDTVVNYKREL